MKKTAPWAGGLRPESLRPGQGSHCRESNSVRTVGGPCEPALDLERVAEDQQAHGAHTFSVQHSFTWERNTGSHWRLLG